jgi:hypothetical protein
MTMLFRVVYLQNSSHVVNDLLWLTAWMQILLCE